MESRPKFQKNLKKETSHGFQDKKQCVYQSLWKNKMIIQMMNKGKQN